MSAKTKILSLTLGVGLMGAAYGQVIIDYGWENGGDLPELLAGKQEFGPVGGYSNVTGTVNGVSPLSGSHMLEFTDTTESGTPTLVIGFVTGLTEGDTVVVSFSGNSINSDGNGIRLWLSWRSTDGSYSSSGSSDVTNGSITTYFGSGGWESSDVVTVTVPAGETVLGIEARSYTGGADTDPTPFYVDDLSVTVPNSATIVTAVPEPEVLGALLGMFVFGCTLLRRKRSQR